MKIGLHYSVASNNNGPGKVVRNLIKGLHQLNVEVVSNEICEYNGVLQLNCPNIYNCPLNSFIGPNISVLPTEVPDIWNRYNNFNLPCEWVYNFYKKFQITQNKNIVIWPVGIDTEKFCNLNYQPKYDVLIYCKNKTENLREVEYFLEKHGLTYFVLIYGKYSEDDFIEKVNLSKSVILLTKTESQGIAYQEILSMNRPCFVIEQNCWNDYGINVPASSVPYFNDECGIITNNIENFCNFFKKLSIFKPRKFILDNLTTSQQASKYITYLKEFL